MYSCPTCGHSLDAGVNVFELRARIARHRNEHARLERRRKQWRDSARRRRAKARADAGIVGYLHALGCRTRYHSGNAKCVPIPCYDRPVNA